MSSNQSKTISIYPEVGINQSMTQQFIGSIKTITYIELLERVAINQ